MLEEEFAGLLWDVKWLPNGYGRVLRATLLGTDAAVGKLVRAVLRQSAADGARATRVEVERDAAGDVVIAARLEGGDTELPPPARPAYAQRVSELTGEVESLRRGLDAERQRADRAELSVVELQAALNKTVG